MNTEEKNIYIEVYSILELLGKKYSNKIPTSLYKMIQRNAANSKYLKYKSLKDINRNNIQKSSLSIIALLHTNYWCESKQEQEEINKIFINNFIKEEKEKRKKFDPDNIFKKKLNIKKEKEVDIIIYKEPLWKKIIKKIKGLL